MLNHYLFQRSILGSSSSSATQLTPALDTSFVLRKLKNYSTDEYSTIDSDGMSVPPLACAFAKMYQWQHVVGIVDEDGYLVLYNTNKTGQAAVLKTWQVHANAVFDIEWLREENKILTASGDQRILLHDVETCAKLDIFKGHSSSVKSISCRSGDDAVFVTGSRDGHIMLWDKRISSKDGAIPPTCTISNAHMLQQTSVTPKARKKTISKSAQQSVTSVLFQDDNFVISAGAVDGCLKVWDIRKNYRTKPPKPVHTFHYPGNNSRKHGYSSLVLTSNGLRLFANCTDDAIYEYDMAAYNTSPVRTWRGHKNSTFYVKSALSPDDQFLLSGSSDELAYIWQINKPFMAPIVLKSHTAEVTSVAWCPNDLTKLVTLSDDSKAKFWRVYCRELKKKFHPEWFGRAEQIFKERATSTVFDAPLLQSKPSSQPASPSIPKSDLQKSKSNITSSPTCITNWLKRKASSDSQESLNSGQLLKKRLHPDWFGRAEEISKERAACTESPLQQSKLSQPVSPSIQKSKSNPTSSPSSITNWLKRKASSDSQESLSVHEIKKQFLPDGCGRAEKNFKGRATSTILDAPLLQSLQPVSPSTSKSDLDKSRYNCSSPTCITAWLKGKTSSDGQESLNLGHELKKKLHPDGCGRAEDISKEKATCTPLDAPLQQSKVSQPGSPSIPKSNLPKSKSNPSSSSTCIINWLKRKASSDSQESSNSGLPPCKIAHRTDSLDSNLPPLVSSPCFEKPSIVLQM
uniref:Uncharacterized protein n=1 Tax=Biomphalaria glabrata TaxID=6526 RepID=A0A2C9M0U7_BIOGL